MLSIEKLSAQTWPIVNRQIAESWGGPYVVSRGVLYDTRTLPGFAAIEDGEVIGYVLYNVAGDECEITVLESLHPNQGTGTTLINEVIRVARETPCRRVWLVTTNDNTRAIRFYQRFGFALRAVHIDAMDDARKLKPRIPLLGEYDIPIQHEFEFEILL